MSQSPLAPPPQTGQPIDRWMYLLWKRLTATGQLLWSQISFTGSDLTDIETRNHNDLQNLNTASYTHLTATNHTDLTDGGATTLHKHDHGGMDGLGDDDHTQYLLANGSRALSADWDAGSFEIRAQTFESDVTTGTAPLVIASTTKVANLNADLLDDQSGSYYLDAANFTGTNWTDLTDGGQTTLHTHTKLVTNSAATYTVLADDKTIVQTTAASVYTLPAAASFTGRELLITSQFAGTVTSNSSDVVPLGGGAAGTAILAATAGKWALLQSDATNWIIVAAN